MTKIKQPHSDIDYISILMKLFVISIILWILSQLLIYMCQFELCKYLLCLFIALLFVFECGIFLIEIIIWLLFKH